MTDPRDRDRHCGSRESHVPHPWDYGRRRCQGWGKYAADQQPVLADAGDPCPARWVGPTGVTWVCIATRHPSDPTRGYMGTGHSIRAVHPVR